jgi:metallo-beta-lactamase class B
MLLLLRRISILLLLFTSQAVFSIDQETVELKQISSHVWIHTSYGMVSGALTDAHGMIIVNNHKIVLVDTCWTNEQTASLLKQIGDNFHDPVSLAIITHAHDDRIGGIDTLQKNNIRTISTPLTSQKAYAAGFNKPLPELDPKLTELNLKDSGSGDFRIEVFYPGPGHTEDNIVVWIPVDHVLFGGCLIKAMEWDSLGYLADAFVDKWASSVQALQIRYPDARIVVPGHGNIGSIFLLQHTMELVKTKLREEE